MRTIGFIALLLLLLPSERLFADSFEIQGGLRAARGSKWKGGEFQIHYLSEEIHSFSFGAFFSSNSWYAPGKKRGNDLEGGPEVRWQSDRTKLPWYGAFQYSALSSGKAQYEHDVGIRVIGPRFLVGLVLPFESGTILNVGLSKGFEKLEIHGDKKQTDDFASFSAFIGLQL